MLTRDDVRRIALLQPEATEADHFGMPSFRVGKKIFCTIHAPDHARTMLKLDPEDQHNLADGETIVPVPGYWGHKGSTFVYFEKVDEALLANLMRLAWSGVAPKRLSKAGP
jgi:predicted DNA-binding protein (MmcQ/YjbR family)